MIIRCPRCSKKYKIDEAALPEEGAYARCSSCENIFFMRKRSQDEIDRLKKAEAPSGSEKEGGGAADVFDEREESGDAGREPGESPGTEMPSATAVDAAWENEPPVEVSSEGLARETADAGFAQDDIDAIFEQASQENLSSGAVEESPSSGEGSLADQDDIDAILAAASQGVDEGAPAPAAREESPAPEGGQEAASQDDIDALFAEAALPAASGEAGDAHPAGEPMSSEQDDIDALLAETRNAAADTLEQAPAAPVGQDGIDAIFAEAKSANSLSKEKQEEPLESMENKPIINQDDIDALLAGAGGGGAEDESAAPEPAPESVEEQDDIDALLAQTSRSMDEDSSGGGASAPPASQQDDIDQLLAAVGDQEEGEVERETAPSGAGEEGMEGDLISQDDIDALLAEAKGDASPAEPARSEAGAGAVAVESELDQLLASGEDAVGEDLFREGAEESVEQEAGLGPEIMVDIDEFGVEAAEEGEPEMEILGIPSPAPAPHEAERAEEEPQEEVEGPIIPEERTEKIVKPSALKNIFQRAKGIIAKLPFRPPALSPRVKLAVTGLAVFMVILTIGGGYWFFFGGPGKEGMEMAAAPPSPGEMAKKEPPPAMEKPAEEALLAEASDEPVLPIGIYLPVEFDREATRIMNVDVELEFDSMDVKEAFARRRFFAAVTLEQAIDSFFENRFYEDTVFVQDKLEEHIDESLKSMDTFAGLKKARLAALSFD